MSLDIFEFKCLKKCILFSVTGSELVTGSEQFLLSIKINADILKSEEGKELVFNFKDDDLGLGWEKCQAQCVVRYFKQLHYLSQHAE